MHILTLRKLLIGAFILAALGWVLVAISMPLTDLVERDFIIAGSLTIYHAIPLHRAFGLIWLAVMFGSILWLDRHHDSLVVDPEVQLSLLVFGLIMVIGGVVSVLAVQAGAWTSAGFVIVFSWLMAAYFPSVSDFREGVPTMAITVAAAFGLCAGFYSGLFHGVVTGAVYSLFVWLYRSGVLLHPSGAA